ncbi:beta-ketoacyl-ACP synthase III [Rheinheimera tangshanensis]|jgi:3-oxoacyl-[acyl-carrier-protein] synthase-3|uniref:Beta-ketoacyl-[acyl-carrier-protein] synthase III n=1 Tax=Rheinheimera tangshanensis TaxID=400153 RepID=A0A5C8LVY7_9GAMM|nr:beta-ketoacyl-ACP synthase III [Rheinheimera tangshanensis]TXK80857.1 ketoacyl-ACP synthase III [Rheinheimera tangshanensis]GGM63343.1 3-oxoacyl-[acyl-carrier-protein] synthase 3 protein 1 [Rheinheimera tangshanensis]
MYSRIIGTGSYFPSQVRTNADLETMVETTDEWIIERTGIKERRIIADNETVATMGAQAALKAIEAAGIDKNSIDMIVMATTSASRALPSAACEVQRELDIPGIPAFDVAAACAGFCYALSIADQYVKSGMAKRVLVIGADCLSRLMSPEDRSMVILFGDAAGAVILEASEQPGILSTHIHADGKHSELLYVDNPIRGVEASVHTSWGSMKGNEVFKVAVTRLSEVVEQTLAANQMDKSQIDWLVPHQANLRIISAVARKLEMSMDQVVINLDRYGNTSAATVPTALDEAVRDGRIQRGQTILLEAFGSGFAWASALIRY